MVDRNAEIARIRLASGCQDYSGWISLRSLHDVSSLNDMTQRRWTYLTTLALATVLAPISTVQARTLTPSGSSDTTLPLSPRSLPTITPLTGTEVQLQPTVQTVPSVSQLPLVQPIVRDCQEFSIGQHLPTAQTNQPHLSGTIQPTKLGFKPNFKALKSAAEPAATAERVVPLVPPLVDYAQDLPTSTSSASAISTKHSAPISVVRSNRAISTPIVATVTAQAEIADDSLHHSKLSPPRDRVATTTVTAPDTRSPHLIPVTIPAAERADKPGFASGSPSFVFATDRPEQIVTTTIAQVDGQIVAAEPSIVIPVQRPKQEQIPAGVQSAPPNRPTVTTAERADSQPASTQIVATVTGTASWYGSEAGSRTANGERYDPNGLTAAHPTLPFGTKVRVTSLKTGKSAIVRINDRGPFHSQRIVDVSAATAIAIGIKNDGVSPVRLEVIARN